MELKNLSYIILITALSFYLIKVQTFKKVFLFNSLNRCGGPADCQQLKSTLSNIVQSIVKQTDVILILGISFNLLCSGLCDASCTFKSLATYQVIQTYFRKIKIIFQMFQLLLTLFFISSQLPI